LLLPGRATTNTFLRNLRNLWIVLRPSITPTLAEYLHFVISIFRQELQINRLDRNLLR
jgi:hypothetical protein